MVNDGIPLMTLGREMLRLRRVSIGVVLALCVVSLLTATAKGEMPASISIRGEKVGIGPNAEGVYRVQINADQRGASFGVEYALPPWPGDMTNGSPIVITGVRARGPVTVRPAMRFLPKPSNEYEQTCQRARLSQYATSYWVEVPAGLSGEIELKGRASYPGWPKTRYDLTFSTFEVDDPDAPRTTLQTVSVPFLGARGTRIIMRSAGKGSLVRDGYMTPEILGRTDPPLRQARIRLRAVRPPLRAGGRVSLEQWSQTGSASVKLGSVRTDGRGQFRLPPQPFPHVGRYAVLARSQAKKNIAADWNCGPFFTASPR